MGNHTPETEEYGISSFVYRAMPTSQWEGIGGLADWVKSNWQEPFGDRRQEVVFIGAGMDREELTRQLDACLLTEDEFAAGPQAWARYEDPFPAWEGAPAAEE